jgi:hypothetical protein
LIIFSVEWAWLAAKPPTKPTFKPKQRIVISNEVRNLKS